jgi:hypothetical protein
MARTKSGVVRFDANLYRWLTLAVAVGTNALYGENKKCVKQQ